jgi:hypothetical protein
MFSEQLNTKNKEAEERSPEECQTINEKCDTIISKIKKKRKNKGDDNG